MKRLRNALSLTLALALALSLSLIPPSAAELTYDNATSFIDVQVNTDVDTEVFIDEADAVDYYNPYWGQTSSNTGYFIFDRDTTITVTYLPGVGYTGNEISEPFVWVALFPYRQQADGSYVSTLGEDEYGNAVPYILSVDGTFQPVEVNTLDPWSYSIYDTGTLRGLNPGESVTFTIPFDEFGDDLLYEVQAVLSFNWQEDPMSGWIVANDSWRYVRVLLDEQAGQTTQPEQPVEPETPVEPEQPSVTTPDGTVTYTVQKGDTLGFITTNYYGNNAQRNALYRANIEAFRATNGQLRPGMTLVIPETLGGVERLSYPVAGEGETLYTVKAGDTLSKIAQSVYGDMWRYQDIFERNSDRLKNANTIYEGQVIVLPQ